MLVSVAVLPGGTGFREPGVPECDRLVRCGAGRIEPKLVVDQSGNEHHIWTRSDGSNTRIQYRMRDQAGNFDPVQTLSTAGETHHRAPWT